MTSREKLLRYAILVPSWYKVVVNPFNQLFAVAQVTHVVGSFDLLEILWSYTHNDDHHYFDYYFIEVVLCMHVYVPYRDIYSANV